MKLFIFISPTFYQKSFLILHHLSALWKSFFFCITHCTPMNESFVVICSMTTATSISKQEKQQHWCLTSKQPTQITLPKFQGSKAISCLVPAGIKISATFIAFVINLNKPSKHVSKLSRRQSHLPCLFRKKQNTPQFIPSLPQICKPALKHTII